MGDVLAMGSYGAWWGKQLKDKARMNYDCTRLTDNLFVGACPYGAPLNKYKFDLIVLCAEEYQPEKVRGVGHIMHLPLRDFKLSMRRIDRVEYMAQLLAPAINEGKKVLVCCMGGLDRSAFVCALILHHMTGMSPACAAEYVKERRRGALQDIQYDWLTLAYEKTYNHHEKELILEHILDCADQRWMARMNKLKEEAAEKYRLVNEKFEDYEEYTIWKGK